MNDLSNIFEPQPLKEEKADKIVMVAGVVLLTLALIAIAWNPDVEAIGEFVHGILY